MQIDTCFIDDNGLPHSAGYLNSYECCELDKLDNALMSDLLPNERRVVKIGLEDERMYARDFEDAYDSEHIHCYGIAFYKKRCLVKKK